MGRTGVSVVLQFSGGVLKARSFSNVGGTVVPSISAIVLSLALCTCQHHCSLSQDKC